MAQRGIYDPHDPWAFRNTWTGEIRNSYDDLWIWMTLIIGLTLLALCILVPILIHIYCKDACFCLESTRCFELFLATCYRMSPRRQAQGSKRQLELATPHVPVSSKDFSEFDSPQASTIEAVTRHVTFHPIPRSYPDSYYPRTRSLPPTSGRIPRRRYYSAERVSSRTAVPRLKLKKKKINSANVFMID